MKNLCEDGKKVSLRKEIMKAFFKHFYMKDLKHKTIEYELCCFLNVIDGLQDCNNR